MSTAEELPIESDPNGEAGAFNGAEELRKLAAAPDENDASATVTDIRDAPSARANTVSATGPLPAELRGPAFTPESIAAERKQAAQRFEDDTVRNYGDFHSKRDN